MITCYDSIWYKFERQCSISILSGGKYCTAEKMYDNVTFPKITVQVKGLGQKAQFKENSLESLQSISDF